MAGFSKLYVIGRKGGFQGADGVNPVRLLIWVGDADRQWLEPHYVDNSIKPLGAIRSIVADGPNAPDSLLDACIAFYPEHFEQCPSLAEAATVLGGVKQLDFDQGKNAVPQIWSILRQEARPYFKRLHIFEADLKPVVMPENS